MDKILLDASFSFLYYVCQRERWNWSGIVFQSNETVSAIKTEKKKKRQGFFLITITTNADWDSQVGMCLAE